MPVLKEKLQNDMDERQAITSMVETEYVRPSVEEQNLADAIIQKISKRFSMELIGHEVGELEADIKKAISEECSNLPITYEKQKRIEKTVLLTALGNGPIEQYLQDDSVTEIVVQRFDNIVIERHGIIEKVENAFSNEEHLETIIKRIVQRSGRQLSITSPIVDARLPDGSRVNATIPPVSVDGATLTVRKFSTDFLSGNDYVSIGSMSRDMLYFLSFCIKGKINLFVSGGTGTGKTTLLNMLSSYISPRELIITIEDSCELKLQQPNVRRMETRQATNDEMMNVDQKTLVRAALRQRPDRIILGETRDGSIVDIVSAMSTGHEGSLTTIHANSPRNMVDVRIPILYSMNHDADFSEKSIALQIAEAVQMIVQIKRFPDGSRKLTHISEVDGVDENGKVIINDIFIFLQEKQDFCATGYIPEKIIKLLRDKGIDIDTRIFTN